MSSGQDRKVVTYGDFIDGQVRKTGQQVKATEVGAAFFSLFVFIVGMLLSAVIIDHWIMELATLGRWGLLLVLVGGAGAFIAFKLLPLIFRRVNPLYAAQTIEEHAPGIKNSLINHLSLRDKKQGTSKGVRRAVEQQAAQRLATAPIESAVDRGRLIRLGYVLLVLMVIAACYKFLSPKDPLTTVGRIAAPWSAVDAPTRVRIDRVHPGDSWVYADQKPMEIEADVRGLKPGEPVTVLWSTEDGRVVDQKIEMKPATPDGWQFRCFLPGDQSGLRQDVRYYVAAGDAKSAVFRIEARTPPIVTVRHVEYEFPRYMHWVRPARDRHEGGDLSAPEGTWVTIHAEANQPIKSAVIDLNCDGIVDQNMTLSGASATGKFLLRLDDRRPMQSYLVRIANDEGHENPQPTRHSIHIHPDKKPEARIVEPASPLVMLPLNGSLEIAVEASDDYGLRVVEIVVSDERDRMLFRTPPRLLDQEVRGPFSNARNPFVFQPRDTSIQPPLKVGDKVRIRALARDNKEDANGKWESNPPGESNVLVVQIVEPAAGSKEQGNGAENPKTKSRDSADSKEQPPTKTPGDPKKQDGKSAGNKTEKQKEKEGAGKEDSKQGAGAGGNEKKQKSDGKGEDKKAPLDPDQFQQLHDQAKEKFGENQSAKTPPKEKSGAGAGGAAQKKPDKSDNRKQPGDAGGGDGKGEKKSSSTGGDSSKPGDKDKGAKGKVNDGKPEHADPASGGTKSDQQFPGKTAPDFEDRPRKKAGEAVSNEGNPKTDGKETKPDPTTAQGLKSQNDPGAKSTPDAKGKGTSAKAGQDEKAKDDKTKSQPGKLDQTGGNPNTPHGASGDGKKSDLKTGSPMPQSEIEKINNDKKTNERPDGQASDPANLEPPSPGQTERESKSDTPGQKGDRSGAGEQGGGQGAKKEGTGGAGSNTNSEQGSNASSGQGTGQTSKQAGGKKESNSPTGASGDKTGAGSKTREGDSASGKGNSAKGKPKSDGDTPGSTGGGDNPDPKGRSLPHGGQGNRNPQLTKEPTNSGASEPSLEDQLKATDMVLKLLRDHPDETGLSEPQRLKLIDQLEGIRDQAQRQGPQGDIARHKLRNLAGQFARDRRGDEVGNLNETLRGGGLNRYPDSEYFDRSGQRPSRDR